jgi:importin-4
MIAVIGQCVETGNESGARQLFDVLETLLILVCTMLYYTPALYDFFSYRKSLSSASTFLN